MGSGSPGFTSCCPPVSWHSLVRPPAEPFFRSLIATRKASSFSPSWDVANDVGTLGRRSLEAKVWSARRGSSPQPPSVARRARLEVVVPTRQHWTKRLMSSVSVLTDCGCLYHCRIHRSLRGPLLRPQHRVGSSAPRCPERSLPMQLQKERRGRRRSSRQGQHSAVVSGGLVVSRADDYAAACSKRNSVL